MKNWLEKYKDGGELNANNSSVSFPEGFVGEGTFNKGRDYSPAWGGQFENGGEIAQLKPGGKVKPIIVTNPRDPRLRAYNDSLAAYNLTEKGVNFVKNSIINTASDRKKINDSPLVNFPYSYKNIDTVQWKGIRPKNATKGAVSDYPILVPGFKKPTQPVIYKEAPERIPLKQQPPSLNVIQPGYPVDIDLPELQQIQQNTITRGKPLFPGGPQTDYYTPIDRIGNVQDGPYKTKEYAVGGSIPGAVGFTYARTGDIPSNGPYAKKTKASAQNGTEMRYYQEGLDWKPKTISKDGSQLVKLDQLVNFTNYNKPTVGGWLDQYPD